MRRTAETDDALAYNAELVQRVEREARDAVRLPGWFWEVAAVVIVMVLSVSVAWPMGFAS